MKTKIIAILVFASLMTKLNAQNHDKVGLLEKPVPVSSVRNITGFFGHRMEVNRNAYLKHFPIDKYVDFVVNRQHSAWDWTQAEQHGKRNRRRRSPQRACPDQRAAGRGCRRRPRCRP